MTKNQGSPLVERKAIKRLTKAAVRNAIKARRSYLYIIYEAAGGKGGGTSEFSSPNRLAAFVAGQIDGLDWVVKELGL